MSEERNGGLSLAPAALATGALSLKEHLMGAAAAEVRRRGLRQQEAAVLAGLKQPELSRIVNARGSGFSTDRLIDVLCRLGHNVEIVVTKGSGTTGSLHITVAPPCHLELAGGRDKRGVLAVSTVLRQ